MSTKIHSGFRFPTDDLVHAHRVANAFGVEVADVVRKEAARWLATRCAEIIDSERVGRAVGEPVDSAVLSPLDAAWQELLERGGEVDRTGLRDPGVDFGFALWLLPDSEGGQVLGVYETELAALRERWLDLPDVEPYAYWNNTDPEEGVPEAEWERRREAWDRVIGADGRLADVGMRVVCAPTIPPAPTAEAVVAHVEPVRERAGRIARGRVLRARVAERVREEGAQDEEGVRFVMEALEWMRRSRGQRALRRETALILPHLPPELTVSDITGQAGAGTR